MTTEQLAEELERHLEEMKDEEERVKDALRALQGRKKPGRPTALKVA